MSDNHGNTPAAWTAVTLGLLAFAVGGLGLVIENMLVFWVGVALAPIALVAGGILTRIGLGGRDHSTERQVDRGREKAH